MMLKMTIESNNVTYGMEIIIDSSSSSSNSGGGGGWAASVSTSSSNRCSDLIENT